MLVYCVSMCTLITSLPSRELDEDTGIVEAQNVSMVQSAATTKLASQADAKFREFGGEDMVIDAYELQLLLNSVFTKGRGNSWTYLVMGSSRKSHRHI